MRLPIVASILLILLMAMWAGLIRLGWALPVLRSSLPVAHGPLMVSGFLGTLIALERAVALKQSWTIAVPALGGLGGLTLALGLPVGLWLITLCSLGLVIIYAVILNRQLALYTLTMAFGAIFWFVGNGLWLAGRAIPAVVPWWAAFLVLTIAGERLELSRVMRHSSYSNAIYALALGIVIGGLIIYLLAFTTGVRLVNLGFIFLALWLLWYDVARRTVCRPGLTRFIAVNLLVGYFWLVVGGVLGFRYAGVMAGPPYDAWLHALFLGFVFGLIFAHALIILPAVTGLSVPFRPMFYGPVVLMFFALSMRIISDLALWWSLRLWGGLLNGIAILWFLLEVVVLAARERIRYERTLAQQN